MSIKQQLESQIDKELEEAVTPFSFQSSRYNLTVPQRTYG
jgi:hypothetical protein